MYGNTLLEHMGNGKFHLTASDQSDCFGGAGALADGTWKRRLEQVSAAESVNFLDRAIYDGGGAAALRQALARVQEAAGKLASAFDAVPQTWWKDSGISAGDLKAGLERRLPALETILDIRKWEGLDHAIEGGRLL